jgi:hypothetical protein
MKVCTWSEWWDNDNEDNCGRDEEASTGTDVQDGAPVKAHQVYSSDHDECLETAASRESKGPPESSTFGTARRVVHRRRIRLVLDIRNQEDFDERHLVSTPRTLPTTDRASDDNGKAAWQQREELCRCLVVHIPHNELTHRRFELPPRHVPFAILVNPQLDCMTTRSNAHSGATNDSFLARILGLLSGDGSAVEIRSDHGNVSDHNVHESGKHQALRPNRLACPWNVAAILLASDETWRQARQSGVSVRQSDLNDTENEQQRVLFQPEPRLWSPDSMVEQVLLPLLVRMVLSTGDGVVNHENHEQATAAARSVEIWDLGAGVGRDVCFLAEELAAAHWSHWRVVTSASPAMPFLIVGLDQRYRDVDQNEAIEFWKRRRVESVTCCRCVDLNNVNMVESLLMAANLDGQQSNSPVSINTNRNQCFVQCFYAVRYWNQPLFAMLVRAGLDRRLRCGTIVAIAQFGKPYANAPWPFPHPKEKHVLERDELRALFTTAASSTPPTDHTGAAAAAAAVPCWNIVHDQVVLDVDHGRTLIQFVAQLQY